MHVQIINFKLTGIGETDYVAMCDQLAPAFAAVPGLQSKVWLADSDGGVYGGVYVWESEQAMQAFTRTELFAGVAGHPNLTDITSRDFGVLAGPTATTSNLQSTTA
jgi:heme-degrading monooxygenase HmoA